MKRIFWVIWLVCAALGLFAQDSGPYNDVIYLKNGSVFRAKIQEYNQGGAIVLEIQGGHTLTFQESDIDRIVQVGAEKFRPVREIRPKDELITKGLYSQTSIGFSSFYNEFDGPGIRFLGVNQVVGYQFNRLLGVGLGSGFEQFDVFGGEAAIPLFVETRLYPFKKNLMPFLLFQGGYGFALRNQNLGVIDAQGGLLLHAAAGVRLDIAKKWFLTFDLGFRRQSAEFTRTDFFFWPPATSVRDITYQRIVGRIGIQFW